MAFSPTFSNFSHSRTPFLLGLALVAAGCLLARSPWLQSQAQAQSKAQPGTMPRVKPRLKPFTSEGVTLAKSAVRGPSPQHLWSLPPDAMLTNMAERADGEVNLGWGRESKNGWDDYYTTFDNSGIMRRSGHAPGDGREGDPVVPEAWSRRGQHAYLPSTLDRQRGNGTAFVRLSVKGQYRELRNLPRFYQYQLQSLRFTPDGECLYVLGSSRLWVVGAQSGRLLRVVAPQVDNTPATRWSDEYNPAQLSPDCRSVLAINGRLALFSTRTGHLIRRYANNVQYLCGGCGDVPTYVSFSGDGRLAIVAGGDNRGESFQEGLWVYATRTGRLLWSSESSNYESQMDFAQCRFFPSAQETADPGTDALLLHRWSDGKTVSAPGVPLDADDSSNGPHVLLTRDGHWVYFVRKNNLYRMAL